MVNKDKLYSPSPITGLIVKICIYTALLLSICVTGTISANTLKDINVGQVHSLSSVKKAYAAGPFGQIHYRYAGEEKLDTIPLLCLHPSPLSGIVYDNWLAEIGTDRYTIAPDTPGYGGSDTPSEPQKIDGLADAMIDLMNNLGIKKADVMGYHTGSFTAADLAMRYPDRIRKVVMISAPIFDEKIIEEYTTKIYAPPPPICGRVESAS